MADPVENLTAALLRAEAVSNLQSIEQLHLMLLRITHRQKQVEARLLSDPSVALRKDELIPFEGGAMRLHEEVKGKRYVIKDEVDKLGGELPEPLRPVRDKRIVVESLASLKAVKPGLVAELLDLAENDPFEEGDERVVKATDKDKYPTVSKIEKEFGPASSLIGAPAKEKHIVLERPGIGDKPLLIGTAGMIGLDPKKEA